MSFGDGGNVREGGGETQPTADPKGRRGSFDS